MRCIVITGGTGSFGQTMVRSLLQEPIEEIRVISRDEGKQDSMRNEIEDSRIKYIIGDVRDRSSVDFAMKGADAVFHAAALKQVPSCDFFPMEAVKTNVVGSDNVIRSAIEFGVKSVVCLSTDKAVFPINAMGISKAMMEKVAQAAARELGEGAATTVSVVRYGNVMYSRGSVIPLFVKQLKAGRALTITEPLMTRFLMPLRDSVALVKFALANANQGDLFIKKSPASTIADLATAVRNLFDMPEHPIQTIGWRHGEKMYETLASAQELQKGEDLGDYWRIRMDGRDLNYNKYFTEGISEVTETDDYHSHNTQRLNVNEVEQLLLSLPEIQAELDTRRAGTPLPSNGNG